MNREAITIVVFCNKLDFFLTRICVASIRYYYPDVEILLVKDELNGKFSTGSFEKKMKVKVCDLGIKKFGWSAAKAFFALQADPKKMYLLLDSDLVFIEPFIERVLNENGQNDIIVSADNYVDMHDVYVRNTYFDVNRILAFDATYSQPEFYFNAGQLFLRGGTIKEAQLAPFFDTKNFPYWTKQELFPMVDQSVYNYLFPKLQKEGALALAADKFWIWSGGPETMSLKLADVVSGTSTKGLIHWAGAKRTPFLNRMSRADILFFFQKEYYKQFFAGKLLCLWHKYEHLVSWYRWRAKQKWTKIFSWFQ